MIPPVVFDHYYRYDELTEYLQTCARARPDLVRVDSIGHSHEGRDIWLATVTNFETGPDSEKPALWIDGNIHATEVSPATACLLTLYTLLCDYGGDPDTTRCLDTRAFYIVPRVNPDGAEWALADIPRWVRSSTRMYPFDEDPTEGYFTEDVDRDGRILWIRIPDPNGPYKPHPDEPRLLIRRDPAEAGGTYYRLLPEGRPINYDGSLIRQKRPPQGLDINRNFPVDWEQEGKQLGSGPYPVSEPEVRAVVDFISRHNNIAGAVSFHTYSGVILRPYGHLADEAFPPEDLWNYKAIGDKGTEITGYANVSVFHDFRYHPKDSIKGVFDDWVYDHRGAFGWTVELWSPMKQAGITDYKYMDWFREHPVEDDLKLLRWNDDQLGGRGYVDWYAFDHPDLGPVEIGGWNMAYCWRNPPPDHLEQEIEAFPRWLLWHALVSPCLEVAEASATPLGEGAYLVRLVVENSGWLPAYVTKKALEKKLVRGLICEIDLPEGASLETGKLREEFGQLEGRDRVPAHPFLLDGSNTNRLKVEWVVRAPQGGSVQITARHDRAGTVRATVTIG